MEQKGGELFGYSDTNRGGERSARDIIENYDD